MPVYKDIIYFDWTLVFTIVNTIITFFIVKRFLYKPVKKMLNAREDEVKKMYDDAETAKASAVGMKDEYERQIASSREQAADIVMSATKKAQQKTDEILAEAQQKAAVVLSRAENQIELDRKKALKEIHDEVTDLAIDAAGKVIKKELDAKEQEKLINDFIESVGDDKWES